MQYRVTTKAGPKVAGRNASPGDVLDLTEPEARYELMAGTIVPHEPPPQTTADPTPPATAADASEPAVLPQAAMKPASKRR